MFFTKIGLLITQKVDSQLNSEHISLLSFAESSILRASTDLCKNFNFMFKAF
jgi:hypothetical protein